jgi:predicted tellurium resistance membrane protein TerC
VTETSQADSASSILVTRFAEAKVRGLVPRFQSLEMAALPILVPMSTRIITKSCRETDTSATAPQGNCLAA